MIISNKIKSKNYNKRINDVSDIKFIILHYTAVDFEDSVKILTSEEAKVSAHYLIDYNGSIHNLVDDEYIAWHAGKSKWKNYEKLNDISIGIEIVNSGKEKFTKEQYEAIINLCYKLMQKYNIQRSNIIAHSDIAPTRKIDPGIFFNWQKLSNHNLGIEFNLLKNQSNNFFIPNQSSIIEIQNNLLKIGYDVKITSEYDKNTSDSLRAFMMHFNPEAILMQSNINEIFDLSKKYLVNNETIDLIKKIKFTIVNLIIV